MAQKAKKFEVPVWGESEAVIGNFYKFSKPITSKSTRVFKHYDNNHGIPKKREFNGGKFVGVINGKSFFEGHKATNNKSNTKYRFAI